MSICENHLCLSVEKFIPRITLLFILFITLLPSPGMTTDNTPDFEKGFMGIAYTPISEVPGVDELPPDVLDGILVTDVLDDAGGDDYGFL